MSRLYTLLVRFFSNGMAKTKLAIFYCDAFVKNSNVNIYIIFYCAGRFICPIQTLMRITSHRNAGVSIILCAAQNKCRTFRVNGVAVIG